MTLSGKSVTTAFWASIKAPNNEVRWTLLRHLMRNGVHSG
jgi:hypothetical protein